MNDIYKKKFQEQKAKNCVNKKKEKKSSTKKKLIKKLINNKQ